MFITIRIFNYIGMYSSGSELIGLKDKIVIYDIVFLDINMTGIDNIKVAEWIRMYSDRVIIIYLTKKDYKKQKKTIYI